uniref:Chymotrypsin-like protease C3 n=1 Tax=Heliothis virescens TaxID=7102 RepID=B4X986_HELVI|nr:chymotrypsin-like protease C3 [Heliothis virescens]
MKILCALILFCVAVARAAEAPKAIENGVYDYHRRIGIPKAFKIRKLESEMSAASSRIIGGSSTTIFSVPYQAGLILRISIFSSVCGGTLISDSRVLTAAHCYNDGNSIVSSIQVILGSSLLFSGGTRIDTNDIVLNPGYNPWIAANDIAVIRIPRVSFSLAIQPVILPSGSELNLNYAGNTALASGYGITRDGDSVSLLQTISSVNLQVITNAVCTNSYGNVIQSHHLCTSGAGRVGVCGGDTGGPLVTTVNNRRILIGVSSFTANSGCEAGLPSGFSRVTSFIPWIHSV